MQTEIQHEVDLEWKRIDWNERQHAALCVFGWTGDDIGGFVLCFNIKFLGNGWMLEEMGR